MFRHTLLDELIRAASFDHPTHHCAALVSHIEVEPRVGIDHFPLRENSSKLERLVDVKFRGKCMVCHYGRCGQQQSDADTDNSSPHAH